MWARWLLDDARVDCEECERLYAKQKLRPPCPQCPKPKVPMERDAENLMQVWQLCDIHERQYWHADGAPLPLTLQSIGQAAAMYGLDDDMQDALLALEHTAIAVKRKQHEARMAKIRRTEG